MFVTLKWLPRRRVSHERRDPDVEREKLLQPLKQDRMVLTTDLDFMLHMNNARYLRECDFGRISFLFQCGLYRQCLELGGEPIVLASSTIRYRRSLRLFQRFVLETRLVYWDENAAYLEQLFRGKSDDFVYATMYAKMVSSKCQMSEAINVLCGGNIEVPTCREDLRSWIDFNSSSSSRLRNKSKPL